MRTPLAAVPANRILHGRLYCQTHHRLCSAWLSLIVPSFVSTGIKEGASDLDAFTAVRNHKDNF